MARLQIRCLGDFQVKYDGAVVSGFETEKARALVAYLAVEIGRPIKRSHLAGLLWSDETEERALHNLRQTLTSLRKVFNHQQNATEYLQSDRDSIQLNPEADIWIDVGEFKKALKRAYQHLEWRNGHGLINIRWLFKAADLFVGQFLRDFYLSRSALFEEWASLTRENIALQAIRALTLIADYHEKRGEYHLAIQSSMRIVELSPWDESARMRVIHLLGLEGQWSAAQSQYFALQIFLKEQLGVPPSVDMIALMEQIRSASAGKGVIHPRYPTIRHHLPKAISSFIGRKAELDDVMDLIVCSENRLITIVGTGGVGKTRLAIEIAQQLVGVFSDGAYFVPVISANHPLQIVQLIGEAIGLVYSEQIDQRKQLLDHLRDREILLVLDNFEHLLADPDSAQLLDEILCQTSRARMLITSREKLNLIQECVYQLHGLNFPAEGRGSFEEIQSYDALDLFFRRAVQLQRSFKFDDANFNSVIQICRAVDGLPLGIELAVAAIQEVGFETVAQKIDVDLDVLISNMANTQPRHRSLKAAFEVSWSLLSGREQAALSRLSIFRGGFDRQAAQAVVSASPFILSSLAAKSLLREENRQRYTLHEAIRQYAQEKLANRGELSVTREKQAGYFSSFLAEKSAHLLGPDQSAALVELHRDFGNVSLAWEWICENQCVAAMEACVDSLYQFFSIRSLFFEGIQWFQKAIQSIEYEMGNERAMGMLLSRLGSLAYTTRDNDLARQSLSAGEAMLKMVEDPKELAYCHVYLGWFYQREKNFPLAQQYAKLASDVFELSQDHLGISYALSLMGSIWNRQGNNREASLAFERALVSCRQAGNPRQLMIVLNRLGDLACYEGDYQHAINLFHECYQISVNLDDRYHQAIMLNNLGTIFHLQENFDRAKDHYLRSLQICEEIGDQDGIALAYSNLGELATAQKDFQAALKYSESALRIAEKLQEHWTVIVCLNSLGEIYCALNMLDKSQEYYLRAIRLALDINGIDLVARVSVNYSRVLQLKQEFLTATALLQAALAHSSTEPDAREKAVQWLTEMNASLEVNNNDQLLEAAARQTIGYS